MKQASRRVTASGFAGTVRSAGFGIVSQGCLSVANFGLVVVAGHLLGATGVGTVMIGFSAYLVVLGCQRGLITEPLIVVSSGDDQDTRARTAGSALTLTLVVGLAGTAVLAAVGVILPGDAGRGALLFAPWIVPALVQDLGRSIVFRDRRGSATVFCDAAWLIGMILASPLAFVVEERWAVVGCWGVGATLGSLVALRLVSTAPGRPHRSFIWWRQDIWPYGRWVAMGGVVYSSAMYASALALVGLLGARDYGGLRAVQSIFAPLTVLGPALTLSGLPLVSRTLRESPRRALLAAVRFGALLMILTGTYVAVVSGFPGVLAFTFGQDFAAFHAIVVPIGLGQLFLSLTFGLGLFLRAQQRGRALFLSVTFYVLTAALLAVLLGWAFGLAGAAWASPISAALFNVALLAAVRPRTILGTPQTDMQRAETYPMTEDVPLFVDHDRGTG